LNGFRDPFFWLGVLALVLAVMLEAAAGPLVRGSFARASADAPSLGWGIRYLVLFDSVLMFGVAVNGMQRLFSRAEVGRLQGIAALILGVVGCLAGIIMALTALTLLSLMIGLLVAVPFGTMAYLAEWRRFPVKDAESLLAMVMLLKVVFCVLLVLAQPGFLSNKPLVALSAASIGLTLLVGFLIAFPPSFLSSITDVVAALIVAVVSIVWFLVLALASLRPMFRALKARPRAA
jgi:hypothetical protein